MLKRHALVLGLLIAAAAGFASTTSAGEAARPNLAQMALRQSDIQGSKVIRQGYVKDSDYVATYEREFDGGIFRALRLSNVESDINYARSLADASVEIKTMSRMFGPGGAHGTIVGLMKDGMESEGMKVRSIQIIRHRSLRLADGGFELAIRARVTENGQSAKLEISMIEFRNTRILGSLFLTSQPGHTLPPGDAFQLASLLASHIQTRLDNGL